MNYYHSKLRLTFIGVFIALSCSSGLAEPVDITTAEKVKPGPPPTYKHGNWYYKIFPADDDGKKRAETMKGNWEGAANLHIPLPEFEKKEVYVTKDDKSNKRTQLAFRTKAIEGGTFFQVQKPGGTAPLTQWVRNQTTIYPLEKMKTILDTARNNLGDAQGFIKSNGTIVFIDINYPGTSPDCDKVINAIKEKIEAINAIDKKK